MTATLTALPGVGIVTVEKPSVNGCIYEIEMLARNPGPITDFAIATVLQAVCHESLRGQALQEAWEAARDAIEILAETDPEADDYEHCWDTADRTVGTLVHGHGYYGGRAA
jgi:hypothetical protein